MDENADNDAQMANNAEMLPDTIIRPRNRFLYVSLPINPAVHHWAVSPSNKARPVEVLTALIKSKEEDKTYIFVYFEDGVVRRCLAEPFVARYGSLLDAYLESERNGTAKPFDFSRGPPYVHPDSRARSSKSIPATRFDFDSSSAETGMEWKTDVESLSGREEISSDAYEDNDDDIIVRRSMRGMSKQSKLPFTHVGRKGPRRGAHQPPTSGSDLDDNKSSGDSALLSESSDVVELRRNNARQSAAKARAAIIGPVPSPSKPRQPRQPRPINQAYGLVKKLIDSTNTDALQVHRPTCGTCMNSPAHKLIAAQGGKKGSRASSFTKMGGWVQCIRCTEAIHWKCLPAADQSEILRAIQAVEAESQLEIDDSAAPVERRWLSYNETTDYICSYCMKGGRCLGCDKELRGGTKVVTQDNPVTTELLYRCTSCRRPAHYNHLPYPFDDASKASSLEDVAAYYQTEANWNCDDCIKYGGTADKILAWRPYPENAPILSAQEEENLNFKDTWPREYLVKWEGKSYRRTSWVPHGWLVTMSYGKLRHFILHGSRVKLEHLRSVSDGQNAANEEELARRRIYEEENGPSLPNRRAQECIPEAWKQVEQILDVRLFAPHKRLRKIATRRKKNNAQVIESSDESAVEEDQDAATLKKLNEQRERSRETGILMLGEDCIETPLARRRRNSGQLLEEDIDDVVWCYVKWGELEYQEATWDTPPKRGEPGWAEFEEAFQRYITAQSVFVAKTTAKELEIRDNRNEGHFERNKMKITQSYVHEKGLHLRPFQVDGINWLSYQWWRRHPAILADEMGLGKTVQVITFLANLVEKKIWPHLVLVPNSTILNWMREFQTWAPQIRAVPYYGEAASRDIIRAHEIFHSEATSGQTRLKLHVLVTTYDTFLTKPEWSTVFKAPSRWEVLIVDEGQRLKNNESLLFQRLNNIQTGHRVLMTGTPLNNNLRELFNLMNFIDPENWNNLKELEEQYQQDTLTADLVASLREKLKDYFLRRTKEILNLPQKHEMIVPVSLTRLQKGIYKSLIEANLALLEGLVKSGQSARPTTKTSKANLRNILMQSRKLVQHPYLVEPQLERATDSMEEMHRQLVDSSGKLKFLEIMLARLKAKGKRVLLFSQFVIALDIIEDFLVGAGYRFLRLDGDLKGSLRQKDIDKFNAPDSEYFIYLLSTRAGGVGINLATADTVIILDPDFNPFQDTQAIARAHRFGQKKNVIVFRLMSTMGPEKKIINAGKKKLLLDHVIVQTMEEEEEADDLTSMLLAGAKALFEEGDEGDINYTESSIDALIDEAEKEAAKRQGSTTESSGMTFEFAQIWEKSGAQDEGEDIVIEADYWAQKISQIQEQKEKEAAQEMAESGRGGRRAAKAAIKNYQFDSPEKTSKKKRSDDSDVDYQEQNLIAGANPADLTSEDEVVNLYDQVREAREDATLLDEKAIQEQLLLKARKREQRRQQRLARMQAQQQAQKHSAPISSTSLLASASTFPSFAANNGASTSGTMTSTFHSEPAQPMREPTCNLCNTRHGPKACPVLDSLEALKALRQRLINSPDTLEDKMAAMKCLDEDIAEREQRLRQQQYMTNSYAKAPAAPSTQPYNAVNKTSAWMAAGAQPAHNRSIGPSTSSQRSIHSHTASGSAMHQYSASYPSGSTSNLKRGAEGPSPNEPPLKRMALGTPNICVLCNQPYHPPTSCPILHADPTTMKRRLDALYANRNTKNAEALQALLIAYNIRLTQPASLKPPRFIKDD